MGKVTNLIITNAGKKSVPIYYREEASKKSKSLDEFYKSKIEIFDVEGDKDDKASRLVV